METYFSEIEVSYREINDFNVVDQKTEYNAERGININHFVLNFPGFDNLIYIRVDGSLKSKNHIISEIYLLNKSDTLEYLTTTRVNRVTTLLDRMFDGYDPDRPDLDVSLEERQLLVDFIVNKEWAKIEDKK